MRDGQPLITDGSTPYSFSQTITNRSTSNVLSISEAVGVAATYTCTVSNDLGSDSVEVVAVGELGLRKYTIAISSPSFSRGVCMCVLCVCACVYYMY